jgi:hypothetical protein
MGITTLDLFRSGNAGGARLERVRTNGINADVDTYVDPNSGQLWVKADGQGSSTFDAVDPTWRGKPWRLPAGENYPAALLLVWNDEPGH